MILKHCTIHVRECSTRKHTHTDTQTSQHKGIEGKVRLVGNKEGKVRRREGVQKQGEKGYREKKGTGRKHGMGERGKERKQKERRKRQKKRDLRR